MSRKLCIEKSFCGRLFISRKFGNTIVRLCQYELTQSVMGISKFIKDHYCAVFQSHSLSMFHAV